MYVYTNTKKCMYTQLKQLIYLYVYTFIITRILVCLQNINDSEIN